MSPSLVTVLIRVTFTDFDLGCFDTLLEVLQRRGNSTNQHMHVHTHARTHVCTHARTYARTHAHNHMYTEEVIHIVNTDVMRRAWFN